MSLTRPTERLGRVFEPYRERLLLDSVSFSEASLAFAMSELPGPASPEMNTALSRWRGDTQVALHAIQSLPGSVPGRAVALEALQTLAAALLNLDRSFTDSDTAVAAAAAAAARVSMDRYHQLETRLQRWLR